MPRPDYTINLRGKLCCGFLYVLHETLLWVFHPYISDLLLKSALGLYALIWIMNLPLRPLVLT